MKDETKKKIKKGALIALQVTLGGFALLGMLSTGALVKSCSKGEINKTAVVATTPVVGQRVRKLQTSDIPSDITWDDLEETRWTYSGSSINDISLWSSYGLSDPTSNSTGDTFLVCGRNIYSPRYTSTPQYPTSIGFSHWYLYDSPHCSKWFGVLTNGMSIHQYNVYRRVDSSWSSSNVSLSWYRDETGYIPANPSNGNPKDFTFSDSVRTLTSSQSSRGKILSAYDFATWALNNGYTTTYTPPVTGAPITYDYAYCAPVGTLPNVVPLDYTSVTLQFQADSGYGFPDTGEEIPGYTQIYSEGLVIDSYSYGGYLGNGMYNAIEIQCSRDSDPPAESCHISVSALSTTGFEYPEWKTLRVLGTHCTIYMADDQFDSDGVVHLQAFPDTGYYFDQDRAFIGNQLKEYYGAEVIMYDLSTGGLYLTIRKNAENLVLNESPYIEITPLAGSVPVGGSDMGQAFDLLRDGFSALLPLFMIQVLPGITLGMLFMVPFIVILILFILKVVHK